MRSGLRLRLLLPLLLGGCTGLFPAPEPPQRHLLEPLPLGGAPEPAGALLAVAPPTAAPGFGVADMAYTTAPFQVNYFARNAWIAPPAQMLQPLLVGALEGSGRFTASADPVAARWQLRSEILTFWQDFRTLPSHGEVRVRLELVNAAGERLAAGLVAAREPAPSDDPAGGVHALNEALRRVLEQAVAFCVEHLPPE